MNKDRLQEIKHKFFFETPLYQIFQITSANTEDLFPDGPADILEGEVEGYNSISQFETTYIISHSTIYGEWRGFCEVTLTCKRNGLKLLFIISKDKSSLSKVAQWPSLATIQLGEIEKKYNKFLPQEEMNDFKKAVIAAAHGFGAGSFVYLRRVFEKLIKITFNENNGSLQMNEDDFLFKRMEEKIDLLKDFLPSQLVEMKSIYSILSNGVHELSEEESLSYFAPLKLSIELILDQKIQMETQRKRDVEVKRQLTEIGSTIKLSKIKELDKSHSKQAKNL